LNLSFDICNTDPTGEAAGATEGVFRPDEEVVAGWRRVDKDLEKGWDADVNVDAIVGWHWMDEDLEMGWDDDDDDDTIASWRGIDEDLEVGWDTDADDDAIYDEDEGASEDPLYLGKVSIGGGKTPVATCAPGKVSSARTTSVQGGMSTM
jgi:hypothetical protein